jgi:citrate synthase
MFAMGRLPGWIAHWQELQADGQAIGRPRQIFVGPTKRPFVPLEKRR